MLKNAVDETERLHPVVAEVGRANEPAPWIERRGVRVSRVLARVRAAAGVRPLADNRAEPPVLTDGKHDELAVVVVGHHRVPPVGRDRQRGRPGGAHGHRVQVLQLAGRSVDGVRLTLADQRVPFDSA